MSLQGAEAAVLQFVIDTLEDCGEETPDHALRHHGTLPDRCCTENGVLSVAWEESPTPPECPAPLKWTLAIRWVTCWPAEPPTQTGFVAVDYAARDAKAARIADVAECVLAAFSYEKCHWSASTLRDHLSSLDVGRTVPVPPGGMCAGVVWRIVVGVKRPESPPT